jgi:hypothetical protein
MKKTILIFLLFVSAVHAQQTSPLPVNKGGQGNVTLAANRLLLGNGTGRVLSLSAGSAGTYLQGGSPPTWITLFKVPDTTGTNGAQWLRSDLSWQSLPSPLPITNGGTNATTQAAAIKNLLPDTATHSGQYLGINAGGGIAWSAVPVPVIPITHTLHTDSSTTSVTNVDAGAWASFAIGANETWTMEIWLVADSGKAGFGINAPVGATIAGNYSDLLGGNFNSISTIDANTGNGQRLNPGALINASIINGSTPGTVQLRYATNTKAILRAGCYGHFTKAN